MRYCRATAAPTTLPKDAAKRQRFLGGLDDLDAESAFSRAMGRALGRGNDDPLVHRNRVPAIG